MEPAMARAESDGCGKREEARFGFGFRFGLRFGFRLEMEPATARV